MTYIVVSLNVELSGLLMPAFTLALFVHVAYFHAGRSCRDGQKGERGDPGTDSNIPLTYVSMNGCDFKIQVLGVKRAAEGRKGPAASREHVANKWWRE